MKRIPKTVLLCVTTILSLLNCMAIPKKAVRIEDRLWIENDYDQRLKNVQFEFSMKRILTRYGHTQLLISGDSNSEPLFLFHAMGLNLTSWIPNIEALSQHYYVIAIDAIGDQGRSVVRRDYPESIEEYSLWIEDIRNALKLDKLSIIGCSMGGWIAHGYAINYPDRVKNLILISPAAGIPQKTKWMKILLKMIFTNDEEKLQTISTTLLGPHQASNDWKQYMGKASKDPKSAKIAVPTEFTDEEIAKTGGNVLLLIGDAEFIYKDPKRVVARARRNIPELQFKTIPNAGHLGAWDNSDFVNGAIINFIGAK